MVYDTARVTNDLSLDKILSVLNPLEIYQHYTGYKVKLNKPMRSPFREDRHPSWTIFHGRNGHILWKDFATGESGGVVQLVAKLNGLTYRQALDRIWADLVTGDKLKKGVVVKPPEPLPIPKTQIAIKRKNFTATDDNYWGQYKLNRDILKHFNVVPIEAFWVNDVMQPYSYTSDCPQYAYRVYDKVKIYRPLSTKRTNKWRSNCGPYDLQGLQQLPEKGDLLIITKSLKDVMVLHRFGYTAVSPQSESASIPKGMIDHLRTRFKKLVVFFDYDEGGIKGANKLKEQFGLDVIFIPKHYLDIYGIKDISDFAKEMSETKTIKLLKELFNEKQD